MTHINKIFKLILPVAALIFVATSCEKLTRPALPSDYPQDKPVTPTTSLRFYLNFDSTSEADKQLNIRFSDSISNYPSFFPDPSTTAVPGVSGTAYQGSTSTFLHYYTANDFGASTNFTISFWIQATLAQKDHVNADGLLSLSSTSNFWSNVCIFADHESSTSDSMVLKFHFANGTGDMWDFQYAGTGRVPKIYDGNWHHIVFTYDATSSTGTVYRDGVQFDQKTNKTIKFDGNASQFVVGAFQEEVNIVDQQSNNTWQSGWPGAIDQVRLYNTALSATDVLALYNNKQ